MQFETLVPEHVAHEAGVVGKHSRRFARVTFDPESLRATLRSGSEHPPSVPLHVGNRIEIEPFPDEVYLVQGRYVEAMHDEIWAWAGDVHGYDHAELILAVRESKVYGTLRVGPIVYEFQSGNDGAYYVREPDLAADGLEAVCGNDLASHGEGSGKSLEGPASGTAAMPPRRVVDPVSAGAKSASSDMVDVLVMYSPAAAGRYDIALLANWAAASMNASFQASSVSGSVRIVHYAEISGYSEPAPMEASDIFTLLNAVGTASGVFTDVHDLRDTHAADVGIFIFDRTPVTQTCGRGAIPHDPDGQDTEAYSVTGDECIGTYNNFAHEIGHNFGGRHDIDIDPGEDPYPYCHGYSRTDPDFRTIMGSGTGCDLDECDRINRWSSPDQYHQSVKLGVEDESDMVQCLDDNMLPEVAVYRTPSMSAPGTISTVSVIRGLCFDYNEVGWTEPSGTVGWYEVETSGTSGFQNPTQIYRGHETALVLSVFSETWVRVRACNGAACGNWTNGSQTATYTNGCL
jgi:hypothetical protein